MTIALDDVPVALQPALAQVKNLLGMHARHFAGRPRAVVDLMLFHEIVDRLEELEKKAGGAPALRDAVANRLALLREELSACTEARARSFGLAPSDIIDLLATRANDQFAVYRVHFAGRARITRRPMLAQRVLINLKMIHHELEHVDASTLANRDTHEANKALVLKQAEQVEGEGALIIDERRKAPRDELVRALGADANAEMIEYRKRFGTRDAAVPPSDGEVDALAGICDRLGELVYEMASLALRFRGDTILEANLKLASRNLVAYETRYMEVAEARRRLVTIANLVTSEGTLRSQLLAAEATPEERERAIARLDELLADPLIKRLAGMAPGS